MWRNVMSKMGSAIAAFGTEPANMIAYVLWAIAFAIFSEMISDYPPQFEDIRNHNRKRSGNSATDGHPSWYSDSTAYRGPMFGTSSTTRYVRYSIIHSV